MWTRRNVCRYYLLLHPLHIQPQTNVLPNKCRSDFQFSSRWRRRGARECFLFENRFRMCSRKFSALHWNCNNFVKFIWNTHVYRICAYGFYVRATRLQAKIEVNHSEIRARSLVTNTAYYTFLLFSFFFFSFGSPAKKTHWFFVCKRQSVAEPKRKMKYSPFHAPNSSVYFLFGLTWLTLVFMIYSWDRLTLVDFFSFSRVRCHAGSQMPTARFFFFFFFDTCAAIKWYVHVRVFFLIKSSRSQSNRQKLGLVPFRPNEKQRQQPQFFISLILFCFSPSLSSSLLAAGTWQPLFTTRP